MQELRRKKAFGSVSEKVDDSGDKLHQRVKQIPALLTERDVLLADIEQRKGHLVECLSRTDEQLDAIKACLIRYKHSLYMCCKTILYTTRTFLDTSHYQDKNIPPFFTKLLLTQPYLFHHNHDPYPIPRNPLPLLSPFLSPDAPPSIVGVL